jgi:hypothetical protein
VDQRYDLRFIEVAEVVGADINKVASLVRTHAGAAGGGGFSGGGRVLV